jgi:uncharacterized membrane protein YbhN (UPF0104 family)
VALITLLVAVGLAVPGLKSVVRRAEHATWWWLAVGVLLEILSCLGYVLVVRMILYLGPPREVRRLAWAEMAFGAVVPAGGAGGLAVGAWAMRVWGWAWSRIVERAAVIFMLTSAVNLVVLGLTGFGYAAGIGRTGKSFAYGLIPGFVGVGALVFFWLVPGLSAKLGAGDGRFKRWMREIARWVVDTKAVALEGDGRELGAVGYLLFDMAVLYVCLRAVGVHASVLALALGYQIGYLANLVPIPGGIGAIEGGITGALVLYGLPVAPTAAAVVIYHAIALWVPTIGGTVSFGLLRGAVAAGPSDEMVATSVQFLDASAPNHQPGPATDERPTVT